MNLLNAKGTNTGEGKDQDTQNPVSRHQDVQDLPAHTDAGFRGRLQVRGKNVIPKAKIMDLYVLLTAELRQFADGFSEDDDVQNAHQNKGATGT